MTLDSQQGEGTDQSGARKGSLIREASMPSLASGEVTHMALSAFALTTGLGWQLYATFIN